MMINWPTAIVVVFIVLLAALGVLMASDAGIGNDQVTVDVGELTLVVAPGDVTGIMEMLSKVKGVGDE